MRIRVIAVGRSKDPNLRALLDEYYRRIGRYAKVEEVEIKDGDPRDVAAKMTKSIPDRSRVVALEVEGRSSSSRAFSSWLEQAENQGIQTVVFLVGGAYGLPKTVSERADFQLSLSAMTLPHRLARVVLAEQVYRAFTILRGEPYDH